MLVQCCCCFPELQKAMKTNAVQYCCFPELQKAMTTSAFSVLLLPRASKSNEHRCFSNTIASWSFKKSIRLFWSLDLKLEMCRGEECFAPPLLDVMSSMGALSFDALPRKIKWALGPCWAAGVFALHYYFACSAKDFVCASMSSVPGFLVRYRYIICR